MKRKGVAYGLWCLGLVGLCGIHRMYLNRVGSGILQLITAGGFGIWQLIDLFLIPEMLEPSRQTIPTNVQQTQNVTINIDKDLFKSNGEKAD